MMTHAALLVLTPDDQMSAVLDVINQSRENAGLPPIPATHPNIQWLATTDTPISIEVVRQLLTSLAYSHATPRYYCFLYANQLTLPAQNALLKSLEEPPENVTIILSCVAAESVLETIQSRCQVILIASKKSPPITEATESNLLKEIETHSFGWAVDTAEQYTDSENARHLLLTVLSQCERERAAQKNEYLYLSKLLKIEQSILKNLTLLAANCNPRLVAEQTFFQIKIVLHAKK